jgi:hypothetical protein
MAYKTNYQTARRLVFFGALATTVVLVPISEAQQIAKPLSSIAGSNVVARISCHGITTVPMTADSAQILPLQIVANVPCGDEVAVLSDFDGYTVAIRISDGKSGYVARMFLAAPSKAPSRPAAASASAEVKGGVAQWQAGAPGCDQFPSEDGTVESVTVNGVTVQVSLQDTGWKLRANVAVANNGADEVHLAPAHFTMDTQHPHFRSLAYQDPNRLASAATHMIYNTAATAGPSVVDASFHPSGRNGSAPSYFSPAIDPRSGFNGSPYATAEAQQYDAAALRESNVTAKSSVAGAVWFERDKHADQLVLRVPVNGVLFEFPLSFKREK